MTSAIFTIAGWSFIVGLVVAAFYCGWQDDRQHDLEAMERIGGRVEPWTLPAEDWALDVMEDIASLPEYRR